jgi:hypothetical protein
MNNKCNDIYDISGCFASWYDFHYALYSSAIAISLLHITSSLLH